MRTEEQFKKISFLLKGKNKKKLIIFGIFLLLLVTGTTLAFFQTNLFGSDDISMTTPKIQLTYEEKSNALSINKAMSDTEGKTSSYFEFDVKAYSTMVYDIFYRIYLTEQDSNLSNQYVKIYLTKVENGVETEVVAPTLISKLKDYATVANSKSIYYLPSFSLQAKQEITHTYRLRAWIADNAKLEINEANKVTTGDTTNIAMDSLTYNFTVNVATKEETIVGTLDSNWKTTAGISESIALFTLNTKNMPNTYQYNNETYSLESTMDVSQEKNNTVILGTYSNGTNKIVLMGQDDGVVAPTDSSNLFSNFNNIREMDLTNLDTSRIADMSYMFSECRSLTTLNLSSFDTSKVTDMDHMFANCRGLTTLNLSSFDTSNVTDMYWMFQDCKSLTSLDVSRFDTSNVKYMDHMFWGCINLTSLDLSSLDTSKVINMGGMFAYCGNLTSIDLSGLDTRKVTSMPEMFRDCGSLTSLNLSSFDTISVTNMSYMFSGCSSLTSLVVSNFDTSNVVTMEFMFCGCSNLTSLDLSSFVTSKVTNMGNMFSDCSSLTSLDLTSFVTNKVTRMHSMFQGCLRLNYLDLTSFDTSNVTDMDFIFYQCEITKAYARTEADAARFNTSDGKTTTWNFVVK